MNRFTYIILLFSLLKASISVQAQGSFIMTEIGSKNFLNNPWDLHFGPDGYLWVTERTQGRVVRVNKETGAKDELIKINNVFSDSRQDGLLGMALHPDILGDKPYVYLSYTISVDGNRKQKIERYTYSIDGEDGQLSDPITLIENLPSSNDHNSGRLIIGPDLKIYYTIGDQGANQNRNYCDPVLSQVLPSEEEVAAQDWTKYPGKVLRLELDGSIPEDNPTINGVVSHIYSYGHRNPQGLVFGSNGSLYSDEHGPDTDDEVNLISAGMNYGWPNVAGYRDDQAYDYCDWSSVSNCTDLEYDKFMCPDSAIFQEENEFQEGNYRDPIMSMFAVTDDYDFNNPICENSWICRPNVAPSSLTIYESDVIPGWNQSLLVSSLKRGRIYRLKLNEDGTEIEGDTSQHFYTRNRYRDLVVDPDGSAIYVITDASGRLSTLDDLGVVSNLANPGMILKFTYNTSVSTDDLEDIDLKIFPNPANEKLTIDLGKDMGNVYAELLTSDGKMIRSIGFSGSQSELEVSSINSGVYFLRVRTQSSTLTKRVIIF